jgi:hypothetical protein
MLSGPISTYDNGPGSLLPNLPLVHSYLSFIARKSVLPNKTFAFRSQLPLTRNINCSLRVFTCLVTISAQGDRSLVSYMGKTIVLDAFLAYLYRTSVVFDMVL